MSTKWKVLGLMSGSSLDGVDLAYCEFSRSESGNWSFQIEIAETIPYDPHWYNDLRSLPMQNAQKLLQDDVRYGKFLGQLSKQFCDKHQVQPDLIASHGHTIFHRPDLGFTCQIGHGQAIAISSGLTVVSDFRTKDIQNGGQGAPLVPIGDELLFTDYDICLNLGGIANISFNQQGKRIAFDVCPANQLLNQLSSQLGKTYDAEGRLAASGQLIPSLLDALNAHPFYKLDGPKSLGNEDVRGDFIRILNRIQGSTEDKLHTVVQHIAHQLNLATQHLEPGEMLITGGGAYNSFLIEQIRAPSKHNPIIPEREIIDFKEAMIFGFLGVLRMIGEVNCLASVTGARSDSCTGVIFNP